MYYHPVAIGSYQMTMMFVSACQYCIWERDHGDTPQHWNHPYINWIGDVTKSEGFKQMLKFLEENRNEYGEIFNDKD